MVVLLAAMFGTSALHYVIIRWLNAQRDHAVIGVLGGIPLSRTHRWQLFFDWVAALTGFLGVYIATIYAFVSIAAMAENESVRLFGYALAALSAWAVLMLGLVGGVSDGMFIVRALRADKMSQQESG